MVCRRLLCIAILLVFVAGCSDSQPAASNQSSVVASAGAAGEPAARAASDFIDAVLQGDTDRASRRLTPAALNQIAESGKQFAPPGLETASFTIGEVRLPSPSQAIVQCYLTDQQTQPGVAPRNEEIACLLRLVENEWRVSGIAYTPGPNRPPVILNFEKAPQPATPSQQPLVGPTTGEGQQSPQTAQGVTPTGAYR